MRTTLNIIIFLFIGLSLQNCGNDCDADCTEIKEAPKEFLDYWYFPKGSWWVYQLQDSTQKVFDTVTLAGMEENYSDVEIGCFDNNYEPCIKRYDAYFEHANKEYYSPSTEEFGGELFQCLYNSSNSKWYLLQVAVTRKLHSYETFVLYPFDTLDTYAYGGKICKLNQTFDFQGKEYLSFSVCLQEEPVGEAQMYSKMTFAQGIGLVSITYDNEETWNLIDYNVNP